MRADIHRNAKATRLARERRHYRPEHLGRPCLHCANRIPLALGAVGYHPTCDPESRRLLALAATTETAA